MRRCHPDRAEEVTRPREGVDRVIEKIATRVSRRLHKALCKGSEANIRFGHGLLHDAVHREKVLVLVKSKVEGIEGYEGVRVRVRPPLLRHWYSPDHDENDDEPWTVGDVALCVCCLPLFPFLMHMDTKAVFRAER